MSKQEGAGGSFSQFCIPKLQSIGRDKFLIMILIGILLFIIALPTERGRSSGKTESTKNTRTPSIQTEAEGDGTETEGNADAGSEAAVSAESYTIQLEKRLSQALMYMEGVGRVKVMITLRSSAEKIVEKDIPASRSNTTETDAEGGRRSINDMDNQETTVYMTDENGRQTPYVIKNIEPAVEGVIVVAEGGGREEVRRDITDVVQALFGIEAHKIKVTKMKRE